MGFRVLSCCPRVATFLKHNPHCSSYCKLEFEHSPPVKAPACIRSRRLRPHGLWLAYISKTPCDNSVGRGAAHLSTALRGAEVYVQAQRVCQSERESSAIYRCARLCRLPISRCGAAKRFVESAGAKYKDTPYNYLQSSHRRLKGVLNDGVNSITGRDMGHS